MAYTFRYKNPKGTGVLARERVRCGKSNCYCAKGKKFHYGWYLRFNDYSDGGKRKKKYIRKDSLAITKLGLGLGKLHDKWNKITTAEKLSGYAALVDDSYDDWRPKILAITDLDPELKRKILNDEPIESPLAAEDEWRSWVLVFTPQENGNYITTSSYRRDN